MRLFHIVLIGDPEPTGRMRFGLMSDSVYCEDKMDKILGTKAVVEPVNVFEFCYVATTPALLLMLNNMEMVSSLSLFLC